MFRVILVHGNFVRTAGGCQWNPIEQCDAKRRNRDAGFFNCGLDFVAVLASSKIKSCSLGTERILDPIKSCAAAKVE